MNNPIAMAGLTTIKKAVRQLGIKNDEKGGRFGDFTSEKELIDTWYNAIELVKKTTPDFNADICFETQKVVKDTLQQDLPITTSPAINDGSITPLERMNVTTSIMNHKQNNYNNFIKAEKHYTAKNGKDMIISDLSDKQLTTLNNFLNKEIK